MQAIVIAAGALFGALVSSGGMGVLGGAAVGGIVAWFILRTQRLATRVEELERRLATPAQADAPRAQAAADEPIASALPSEPVAAPLLVPAVQAAAPAATPSSARTAGPTLEPVLEPVLESIAEPPTVRAPPVAAPAMPRAVPSAPAPPGPLRRLLFGGNTVVKAGVAILFLGLAFLARFAAENVHVALQWRLGGIALVAIVLLVIGWRLRSKRRGYAMVLQGGAIAVLYLTLFAAFRFYGLVALLPAFVLMVAVAGLAAALAVLQDAPALAITGALGGFATPVLLSTGGGQHVPLFSYYLVLDLGIAAIAWWRHWRVLNLIAFVCTYGVAAAWGARSFEPAHALSCEFFLIAAFVLFAVVTLLPARQAEAGDARARWMHGSLLFGLPTATLALQYGIVRGEGMSMALTALALGAFYILVAARARRGGPLAAVFEPALTIGAVLVTLVLPFGFDAQVTSGAWALEGAGLLWAGLRQRHGRTRLAGYALLLLAGLAAGHAHLDAPTPAQAFNAPLINALLIAFASLAAAWFVHRQREAISASEAVTEPALLGWATLWLLGAAFYEVVHYVENKLALAALMVALAAVVALYLALARRLAWPAVAVPVMAHAPWLALALALSALAQPAPLLRGGWWAWPIALAAFAATLRWAAPAWPEAIRRATHALGPLLIGGLGALELRALTANWGEPASAWPWLGWLVAPAVVLGWLLWQGQRALPARHWPLRDEPFAYQVIAGGVLAASLLGWAMLANVASNGASKPLPHVPLVNPLDLGIGLALVATAAWWRSAPLAAFAKRQAVPAHTLMLALFGAAVFAWLNGMLIRAFHHYGDVPYRVHAWVDSLAVQTGLALLWTAVALALMWTSARRGQRPGWLVGSALLGVVVAKLLLVDLSGSGTVTRIVSFIGVGVLMLVIGYVAPLPAKKEAAHAD